MPESERFPASTLSFRGSLPVLNEVSDQSLVDDLKTIEQKMDSLNELHSSVLTDEDRKAIRAACKSVRLVRERHELKVRKIQVEKEVINAVNVVVKEFGRQYKKVSTDAQKLKLGYDSGVDELVGAVSGLVKLERAVGDFVFDFEPITVDARANPVGELSFVSKTKASVFDPRLMRDCLGKIVKARHAIDFESIDSDSLIAALKNYPEDATDPIEVVRENLLKEVRKALSPVKAINRGGDDVYEELSQGFNAQLYFSLLRDSSLGDGVYCVDQPEDQISQRAIKDVAIGEFREIAESRQVLLITHNPQFLVNLDVDNVIFVGKEGSSLSVKSGALEYECADYKMLDIVAENVDGGLDAIRKRMKRYEKAN